MTEYLWTYCISFEFLLLNVIRFFMLKDLLLSKCIQQAYDILQNNTYFTFAYLELSNCLNLASINEDWQIKFMLNYKCVYRPQTGNWQGKCAFLRLEATVF